MEGEWDICIRTVGLNEDSPDALSTFGYCRRNNKIIKFSERCLEGRARVALLCHDDQAHRLTEQKFMILI